MIEYLKQIIEVDVEAKKKVIEIENKIKNIEEFVEREITKQKHNLNAEIQFKLEYKKRNIEKDYETFLENMRAYEEEQIQILEQNDSLKRDSMIEQAFHNIISKKKVSS